MLAGRFFRPILSIGSIQTCFSMEFNSMLFYFVLSYSPFYCTMQYAVSKDRRDRSLDQMVVVVRKKGVVWYLRRKEGCGCWCLFVCYHRYLSEGALTVGASRSMTNAEERGGLFRGLPCCPMDSIAQCLLSTLSTR